MLVSKIKLPSEIAQRMKEPRVVALAESSADLGGDFMHAPTVNADVTPPELVAGRDRMAAALLRKRKKVWVHVGKKWTPLDLLKAEVGENLHRRHDDKDALTARLVDKAEEVVSGQVTQNSPGRPAAPRREAQRLVAEASGQDVEAVRSADRRAAAKVREAGDSPTGSRAQPLPAPSPSLIETFGHDLPEEVADGLAAKLEAFDRADKMLRQAQAAIGDLALTNFPAGIVARLKEDVHAVAAKVRGERPHALCPYCKGSGAKCGVCMEQGVVSRSTFEAAPEEKRVPVASRDRKIPPIKAGVTYTTNDQGDVVEQAAWHRETAAMHAKGGGGPCGCKSCNVVRREKGEPEVDLSKKAATAKPKKGIKVEYQGETLTLEEFERRTNGTP